MGFNSGFKGLNKLITVRKSYVHVLDLNMVWQQNLVYESCILQQLWLSLHRLQIQVLFDVIQSVNISVPQEVLLRSRGFINISFQTLNSDLTSKEVIQLFLILLFHILQNPFSVSQNTLKDYFSLFLSLILRRFIQIVVSSFFYFIIL